MPTNGGGGLTKRPYDDKAVITMRETDNKVVDYEKLRKAQM